MRGNRRAHESNPVGMARGPKNGRGPPAPRKAPRKAGRRHACFPRGAAPKAARSGSGRRSVRGGRGSDSAGLGSWGKRTGKVEIHSRASLPRPHVPARGRLAPLTGPPRRATHAGRRVAPWRQRQHGEAAQFHYPAPPPLTTTVRCLAPQTAAGPAAARPAAARQRCQPAGVLLQVSSCRCPPAGPADNATALISHELRASRPGHAAA